MFKLRKIGTCLVDSEFSSRLIGSGYEETRKKSGPKQGYVKKLEQKSQTLEHRLAQLEKLLATHQNQQSASPSMNTLLPTPLESLHSPSKLSPPQDLLQVRSINSPSIRLILESVRTCSRLNQRSLISHLLKRTISI